MVSASAGQAVVALQPHGDGVPLFLVAPGMEAVGLTRHLGSDRPLFGIRLPSLETVPGPHCIEGIAGMCVREIRKVRPVGPYALAGWCSMGFVALEIARQLEREGAPIGFVAMIDARTVYLPPMSQSKRLLVRACHFGQRVLFLLSRTLRQGLRPVLVALISRWTHVRELPRRVRSGSSPGYAEALEAALQHHRPLPWAGRLIHIWAAERPRGFFRDPQFICGFLSPRGFGFHELPGDHLSMLSEPRVAELAQCLASELDLAGTDAERGSMRLASS